MTGPQELGATPGGPTPPVATVSAAVATESEAPPKAVWSQQLPSAPWCPPEWEPLLEAAAPGVLARHGGESSAQREVVGAQLTMPGWTLVLASRRGRVHAHRGEHREDAGALLALPQGAVAAVADGAGSAPWSRLGSALAVHAVTQTLRSRLTASTGATGGDVLPAALRTAAGAAQEAMRQFATAAGLPFKSLRCTLLLVAVHGEHVGVLQVGDGAMALRHRDGTLQHPQAAATGDFSGEVAHFLPDDGALEVLQASAAVFDARPVQSLLLATDGVEDPWYPFTRHAGTLFDALRDGVDDTAALPAGLSLSWAGSVLRAADPVRALSEWLAFEKRGENDDRTLCLIERVG